MDEKPTVTAVCVQHVLSERYTGQVYHLCPWDESAQAALASQNHECEKHYVRQRLGGSAFLTVVASAAISAHQGALVHQRMHLCCGCKSP